MLASPGIHFTGRQALPAENTCALNPVVWSVRDVGVAASRPLVPVRRARTPNIFDRVARFV